MDPSRILEPHRKIDVVMIPCDSPCLEIDRSTTDQPMINALTSEFGVETGDRRELLLGDPIGHGRQEQHLGLQNLYQFQVE